ncbi:ATPase, T2SS/T4P/T4SS family [Tissierella sp.]|uniref:GspE/PulE family protein n=1 Tax=Tissierella sp. TaxID=41274 RepID=UPI002866197D|nr:ATPase, T2SS/T4P/T4SS family [Tissierella sp.]MDR7856013.1 ATPase, T2SS/T4P/T4SS family [Tissierella sp.]
MANTKLKLGELLVSAGKSTEEQLGIPHVDLDKYPINAKVATIIPEIIVRRYELIAIDKHEEVLVVAMVDPLNIFALDDVRLFVKSEIQPVIANKEKLLKVVDEFYSSHIAIKVLEEFEDNYSPINTDDIQNQELLEVTSAPIVKLLNSIIEQAVRDRASDIHIEPNADDIRVRFRIDGELNEIMTLARHSLSPIITRIKIMGKMNIAEKRISQDGRVETMINNKEIDMRISTLPTIYGEKTVIRLLDRSNFGYSKESLGFSNKDLERFDNILAQPYGMILVTGPTGSGTVFR